jgi:murein DD-endopeptidase MepM/ murein hydrolase activator NlpD
VANAHQWIGAIRGRPAITQRFAFDFLKQDENGMGLEPADWNDLKNEEFHGHGEEVLAVADGVVARVVDGIPENKPYSDGKIESAVPLTRETYPGNWVSIDIGDGQYALYAHLQPGEIRVEPGQTVTKGQVIGLVGNSGNSAGPHLHFGLADRPGFNSGEEGLPYVFEAFETFRAGGAEGADAAKEKVEHRAVMPVTLGNTAPIVYFPE